LKKKLFCGLIPKLPLYNTKENMIMKNLISSLVILMSFTASAQSPHLHLDQFGYTPNADKKLVLSDPHLGSNNSLSYIPVDSIELREYSDQVKNLVGYA